MVNKIVFATGNPHKLQEVNEIASGSGVEFILPPPEFDPVESGLTFAENSVIKAREASRLSKTYSLADDSGLCVEALNWGPGIYSARYALTPQSRIDKLLKKLANVDNRYAKFVCVMTLTDANGEILTQSTGECHGVIAQNQSGTNGFGYDPVFLPDGFNGKSMADLTEELKNEISHRSIALKKIIEFINNNLV